MRAAGEDRSAAEVRQLKEALEPLAPELPVDAVCYSRTATFTHRTVPKGLLKDHSTKPGVRGLLRVEAGELLYRVTDARRPASSQTVSAGGSVVIEPTVLHLVEPGDDARFHVSFFRTPG